MNVKLPGMNLILFIVDSFGGLLRFFTFRGVILAEFLVFLRDFFSSFKNFFEWLVYQVLTSAHLALPIFAHTACWTGAVPLFP